MAAVAAAASNARDTAIDTGCLRFTFDTGLTAMAAAAVATLVFRIFMI
jgi:hypothetical protein